jgi:hypothetical protein
MDYDQVWSNATFRRSFVNPAKRSPIELYTSERKVCSTDKYDLLGGKEAFADTRFSYQIFLDFIGFLDRIIL